LDQLAERGVRPTIFLNNNPLFQRVPLHNHKNLFISRYLEEVGHGDAKQLAEDYDVLCAKEFRSEENEAFVDYVAGRYLTQEQVEEWLDKGVVSIGSHTSAHNALNGVPYAKQDEMIRLAHNEMESRFSRDIPFFSFPFGDVESRDFISEYLGATCARYVISCNGGINQNPDVNGALLRIGIHNEDPSALNALLARQFVR